MLRKLYQKKQFFLFQILYKRVERLKSWENFKYGEIKMGYALFTARKLSISTRLNMCNANLACNTEKTYSLSNSIFVQQSKRDLELSTATQNAYSVYEKAVTDANS